MNKNTIVVLSDIHIGDNSPTVWYQKTIHEGFLMAVLDDVIKNKTTVLELILLGDVVDFWTYAVDDIPPTFDEIIAANPNIFGPNGKLSQVLTALEGKVTYVRGNHDMNITQADLNKIQNPKGYKIKLVGDVYFPLGPNNRRILCTHGHLDTIFNAPYNEPNNPIAPMPIGHFITRAISTSTKKKINPGQSVVNLPESGNPGFGDLYPSLEQLLRKANKGDKEAKKDLLSVARLVLEVFSSQLGVSDNQPINLPGGKIFTVGQAKTVYKNLFTEWVNKRSLLTAIKSIAADTNGTYLGWFAQQRGFQQGADLVVMGVSHYY
jgi:UDP-2,3-diacylglucosamine pyrophosphatase LpxH